MYNPYDRITIDPNHMNGAPCIRGLPIRAADVALMVMRRNSENAILEAYPELEREDIQQAQRYVATGRPFTWEYIQQRCERVGAPQPSNQTHPLCAVVPQLRAHPELHKLIPMMSMWLLRWFPSESYEVLLHTVKRGEQRYSSQ